MKLPVLTHSGYPQLIRLFIAERVRYKAKKGREKEGCKSKTYLLVAILPGEVQEAGGEQLILGPGITVHGVCAKPSQAVSGVVGKSAGVLVLQKNGRFLLSLSSLDESLFLSLCVCPGLLLRPVPLEAVKRAV